MEAALTTREQPARHEDGHEAGELALVVARAAAGDERAWETLVSVYSRRVYAMAQSRLRRPDLAEEITQSVFVTIATKLRDDAYIEQGRFEAWLFRVTMNRVRDAARRMKRQAVAMEPSAIAAMGAEAPGADDPADLAALRAAVGTLAEADREVIELRHHGQLGFKEIAEMLGEPLGTVLARHHRALKKLRGLLERQDSDETNGKDGLA